MNARTREDRRNGGEVSGNKPQGIRNGECSAVDRDERDGGGGEGVVEVEITLQDLN